MECKGTAVDADIQRGVKWIGEHLKEVGGEWRNYALYNVERLGTAGGYKYIGDINWYDFGADVLVKSQIKLTATGTAATARWLTPALRILFMVHGSAAGHDEQAPVFVGRSGQAGRTGAKGGGGQGARQRRG